MAIHSRWVTGWRGGLTFSLVGLALSGFFYTAILDRAALFPSRALADLATGLVTVIISLPFVFIARRDPYLGTRARRAVLVLLGFCSVVALVTVFIADTINASHAGAAIALSGIGAVAAVLWWIGVIAFVVGMARANKRRRSGLDPRARNWPLSQH